MRRFVAGLIAIISMASCMPAKHDSLKQVVLPDPKLLGCMVFQRPLPGGSIPYPKRLLMDFDQVSVRGMIALYDRSVPIDDLKIAIDERYGKWAASYNADSPVKSWRVEPEKCAIQLSAKDDGTKQVIYLAFVSNEQIQDLIESMRKSGP